MAPATQQTHLGCGTMPALKHLTCGHCLPVMADRNAPHSSGDQPPLGLPVRFVQMAPIAAPRPSPPEDNEGIASSIRDHRHRLTAAQTS